MNYKGILFFKNLHLVISLLIVVPTAIIYGTPSILSTNLNIEVSTIDLSNLLKAIMCLYIGISCIWLVGIIKEKYWKSATQLNILFMLTLATGRILSIIMDGIPTNGYVFGVIAELIIGLFSVYQLKKYKTVSN
ncbi:DUF4345 domain-containing protein [Tenacibaculum halocynthiae]|uniref:DUF4345 domain-containing protein n=1 Tax=Tenacibaculum halocynthiae TaxID=1254437 RepID=UPI0038938B01